MAGADIAGFAVPFAVTVAVLATILFAFVFEFARVVVPGSSKNPQEAFNLKKCETKYNEERIPS